MKKIKFAVKALGCKVNQYEEQALRENLREMGFEESEPGSADVFILNSCTVTDTADAKTRKLIRSVKKSNPALKVFVTGCYAVFEEDIAALESMPEVEGVIPGKDKRKIPSIVANYLAGEKTDRSFKEEIAGFHAHTRAFLKVQDGCDQRCAYCKVSLVRGPSRSRGSSEVLEEAARLAAGGYREIVITGICLGSWRGKKGERLPDLVKELDGVAGDFRIRLSSIEPNHIDGDLINAIACSGKVCRHLHVPLQSGSDRMLSRMNRRYDSSAFRDIIGNVRRKMPMLGLTMDVIAGFPGETDKDFARTMDLIGELMPSRLHVFRYSDRKGTPAYGYADKVPSTTAKERVECLIKEGEKLQMGFCGKFIGKEVDILVEERKNEEYAGGYTGEYLMARINGADIKRGQIVRNKVTGVDKTIPCLLISTYENR